MSQNDDALRSARFRAEREAQWRNLEALVSQAETRGTRRMGYHDVRNLVDLYRQATTSLAIAREISLDKALLAYLEALTARAYLTVYAPQTPVGGVMWRFFSKGAPQALRRSGVFILLGVVCMGLGVLAGYLLYFENADWFYVFMPAELAGGRTPEATTGDLLDAIYSDTSIETGALGAFASYLFSHNTRIAFLVFGLGLFLCAPALILTFLNGLTLGAFLALHVERGIGWDLGGWLSIHGVTEIGAICVACAGGLKLGSAAMFPGMRSRADSLRHAGHDAAKLAIVAAFMLIVAAILEGFARQMVQDMVWRYVLGWGIGALWLSWAITTGKERIS
jgi:uncharacterized membrane protein SpoIIM required for sporulation